MADGMLTIEVIQAGDGGQCATCGYTNKRCAVFETHGVTFSVCTECLTEAQQLLDFDVQAKRVGATSGGSR